MEKQFKIFSVDTKAFYTDEEREINNERFLIKQEIGLIETWAIYKFIYDKEDVTYQEFKNRTNYFNELKSKKEKTTSEEVELKELRDFFSKPRKSSKKSIEYKTAQELKLEKEIKGFKSEKELKSRAKEYLVDNELYKGFKRDLSRVDNKLNEFMQKSTTRRLSNKALTEFNQVTLFDNSLSRIMNISPDNVVTDLIIVRAYHYKVLEQLIENGFIYIDDNGEIIEYRVFTSSAGQIRNKKVVFIRKDKWEKYERALMCGLTIKDINESTEGGCNINKFLAYLALCNSATDEIVDFDINKAIVIEDFESDVFGEIDYIDNKTFEVTRKTMSIPIPHSDGCGWVLPKVSKKNFMVRLPWVKGLLTPVDYLGFCDEYRDSNYKITDIYGKVWDLKEDDIEYVFTKSQFKMWKYYPNKITKSNEILEYGWDTYVKSFKEFGCKANMCNLEPDTKEFRKANFNYQMWQTLTDITDEEIAEFTDKVDEYITKGYSDRKTMLNMLGADETNKKKSNLQKCIEIYPELIRDYHVKEELASMLNARKKEAKYGKFKIDSTYTFIIPDVFAWLQNVFLGQAIPNGLLNNGEVSCKLYKKSNELLVNRSPHLYKEHAVRDNIVNELTKKWFITDGVYTSSKDLISKILQFDVDGDRGLVVADKNLINIAKRNMDGIVPLYYEMGKAKAQKITETSIYESLVKAFSFNNIGKFSNKLTVMWNLKEPKLQTIAQITALNNFTIDGAKTLLVPDVPSNVEEEMKVANGKLPYFFQFAKDKDSSDVAEINDSTVNRICRNIENIKRGNYDFSSIGKFNKNILMRTNNIELNNTLVSYYLTLEQKRIEIYLKFKDIFGSGGEISDSANKEVKELFIYKCKELGIDLVDGVDMIIRYIYSTNRNGKKGFLFDLFGDIIYDNLKSNIKKPLGEYIMCETCGDRTKLIKNNQIYCEKCAKELIKKKDRERKRSKNSIF